MNNEYEGTITKCFPPPKELSPPTTSQRLTVYRARIAGDCHWKLKLSLYLLQLARVADGDWLARVALPRSHGFHGHHYVHARGDAAEYAVLAVQIGGVRCADEELRAVGVGTGVCHREGACAGVLELKVLVRELLPVDALAASAVAVGEVAALWYA